MEKSDYVSLEERLAAAEEQVVKEIPFFGLSITVDAKALERQLYGEISLEQGQTQPDSDIPVEG